MKARRRRVVAIASSGGHWMQLRRMASAFPEDTIWVSTNPAHASEVREGRYRRVPDANRWNKPALAWSALRIALLVVMTRPTHLVTTGAAPGWFALVFARFIGARTLWVDSIANAEELSLSGSQARRWATEVWTQWPELEQPVGDRQAAVECHGSVL